MFLLRPCVLVAALLCAVPVLAEELATPQIIEKPETKLLDSEGAGKLYQVGEHLLLVMEGTPREMGYQHGRLLAKSIHHGLTEGYVTRKLYNRGYKRPYIMAQSERMEKFFSKENIEELNGIVEGLNAAGVKDLKYEDVRLGVTQGEILHFEPDAAPQCSNFAVFGEWTPDGRLLHGRNLDWDVANGAQEDAAILVWRPKGGTPFMMVGWAGGIGSVSGMNAKGITLGEMTLFSTDVTFDGTPLMVLMRRALEKGSTLDEAVAILRDTQRTSGWNFVVGDGKIPDARALETDAHHCGVYKPSDPAEGVATAHKSIKDCVRRTNHPVSEDQLMRLAAWYGKKQNVPVPADIKVALPLLKLQNTYHRYTWLGEQIEAHPKTIDVAECLRMLANGPVKNDVTLHSWVFDPKNSTAYVAIAGYNPPVTATERPYTKIDLAPYFKN